MLLQKFRRSFDPQNASLLIAFGVTLLAISDVLRKPPLPSSPSWIPPSADGPWTVYPPLSTRTLLASDLDLRDRATASAFAMTVVQLDVATELEEVSFGSVHSDWDRSAKLRACMDWPNRSPADSLSELSLTRLPALIGPCPFVAVPGFEPGRISDAWRLRPVDIPVLLYSCTPCGTRTHTPKHRHLKPACLPFHQGSMFRTHGRRSVQAAQS